MAPTTQSTQATQQRVLSALSGGVDSSVATALLIEAGYDVVGITMKLWGGESDTGCCSVSDVEDARRSASQLGVDHHVFNFSEEFNTHVVDPYVADHAAGRTPNPCVECNRHLKFDVLLQRASVLDFEMIATGHHAQIVRLPDGTARIGRGADQAKDQSYVLYPLTARELERVVLPIGHMTKDQVREHAARLGLRTATKPDSQDVCFITKSAGRERFLGDRMDFHAGRIVDLDGAEVGTVDAVELVTIGQRRGLNLAGGSDRRFVVDVDVPTATVTIGERRDLLASQVRIENVVWADQPVTGAVTAQYSAHGTPVTATVTPDGDEHAVIVWDDPERRIAPGQSVVMYQRLIDERGNERDLVVGGGLALAQRA